jgi:hypothetical protein
MSKPRIYVIQGIWVCSGGGVFTRAGTKEESFSKWETAVKKRAASVARRAEKDKLRQEARKAAAIKVDLPTVPARTPPVFKPLKSSPSQFTLNAARARAAQPPMMGIHSNAMDRVEQTRRRG